MWMLLALIIALACVPLIPQLGRAPLTVVVDDVGVRRMSGARVHERCDWSALVQVSIVTTDVGPGREDLFFLLHATDGSGCAVPHSDAVAVDLLTALQRLPGFDNAAVAEAMGSTTEAMFVCWKGEAAGR